MSPGAGRSFGAYRLLRVLATDAVTTTYYATLDGGHGAGSGAHVTVRIAGRFDRADEHAVELVRRFQAQVQRAGAVDHPAIVRPTDVGVIDGHPYVVTPFVRAVPLGEMLAHDGAINETAALAIFAQIAGGLDAAHRAGVVHGSLSPRTIWIGPSSGQDAAYVGYVVGFGSGLLLRERMARDTRGAPVEDILYVAPEQLRGEAPTRASDQYALACAVFHTLAGRPPFEKESSAKLYGAHLLAPAPSLASADPAIAEATSAALRRAMSKRSSERFPSCGVLINAALPARSGGRLLRPVTAVRESSPARSASRSRAAWPLVLAGIGLVLVGLVLWLLLRPGPRTSAAVTRALAASSTTPTPSDTPTTAEAVPARWSTAAGGVRVDGLHVEGRTVAVAGADGTVTGLRAAGGRRSWRASLPGLRATVTGDGVVAVAGALGLTVLDAGSGDVRWIAGSGPTSGLLVAGGAVVGVADGARVVRAVDIDDGSERWRIVAGAGDGPLVAAVDGATVYVLHGRRLSAFDVSAPVVDAAGRRVVGAPRWQVGVEAAWPLLVPMTQGVVMATRDGRACARAANDGDVDWCSAVPGAAARQPALAAVRGGVVAVTADAVVALERGMGGPLWSVSPGGSSTLVAVSGRIVAVGQPDGVTALDAETGDQLLAASGLGRVTSVAAHGGWMVVGTQSGAVRRFDAAPAGG